MNVFLIIYNCYLFQLVCASVMLFACQTKYDFTTCGGILFCAALAVFFPSIFTPLWLALNTTAGTIILGGVLALLFVAFLAYDVQLVMGGRKYELSPEEYIFASLILYMDIIRIFLLLLAIFGHGNN
ncbi:protein lifeguard 2-like [Montipora foliosa]|uniref:protein lifeguard 2-like n=1 Tax=Montipora foliosa TaxID=591990 RepID=UPI0035F1F162